MKVNLTDFSKWLKWACKITNTRYKDVNPTLIKCKGQMSNYANGWSIPPAPKMQYFVDYFNCKIMCDGVEIRLDDFNKFIDRECKKRLVGYTELSRICGYDYPFMSMKNQKSPKTIQHILDELGYGDVEIVRRDKDSDIPLGKNRGEIKCE